MVRKSSSGGTLKTFCLHLNLDNRIDIHQAHSSVDVNTSAIWRCATTPEGRAGNILQKYRTATGRAMKHRRDNDTSVREIRAARREPRGGLDPMKQEAACRLMILPVSGVIEDKYRTKRKEEPNEQYLSKHSAGNKRL